MKKKKISKILKIMCFMLLCIAIPFSTIAIELPEDSNYSTIITVDSSYDISSVPFYGDFYFVSSLVPNYDDLIGSLVIAPNFDTGGYDDIFITSDLVSSYDTVDFSGYSIGDYIFIVNESSNLEIFPLGVYFLHDLFIETSITLAFTPWLISDNSWFVNNGIYRIEVKSKVIEIEVPSDFLISNFLIISFNSAFNRIEIYSFDSFNAVYLDSLNNLNISLSVIGITGNFVKNSDGVYRISSSGFVPFTNRTSTRVGGVVYSNLYNSRFDLTKVPEVLYKPSFVGKIVSYFPILSTGLVSSGLEVFQKLNSSKYLPFLLIGTGVSLISVMIYIFKGIRR